MKVIFDILSFSSKRDSLGEVELGEVVQTTHRLGNTLQLVVIQEKHFQGVP